MASQFIENLPKYKQKILLEEMRIHPDEDVISSTEISGYGGKMYVVHGHTKSGIRVESIYTDFIIEKLYNSTPSEYDIDRYQNTMIKLCGEEYSKQVSEFNKKFRASHDKEYVEGDSEDEEEYED